MMDALFWSILLLLVGLGLMLLELFVPSAGVIGVLAALAIVGSVVMAFTGGWVSGSIMLAATLILVPAIIAAGIRWWPYTPIGRLLVLQTPDEESEVLPDTPEYRDLPSLVGRRGVAKTMMLPSGAVLIDGKSYDAVSDGLAIDAGQAVRVKAIRANRIIVDLAPRALDEQTRGESSFDDPSAAAADVLDQPASSLGLQSLEEPPA